MADIELVIKIDKKVYDCAKELGSLSVRQVIDVEHAIKNGTPLPKGHGRLIILSEDAIKREQTLLDYFSRKKWISEVGLSNATVAIIEADKAESEDKE